MPKSKEGSSRIAMFQELKIPFVYTLEASFAGASKGELAGQHFSVGDLKGIGRAVLAGILALKKMDRIVMKQISTELAEQQS